MEDKIPTPEGEIQRRKSFAAQEVKMFYRQTPVMVMAAPKGGSLLDIVIARRSGLSATTCGLWFPFDVNGK